MHKTWGAAAIEPRVANITVTYLPSIISISSGPFSNFSSFGGVTINITGDNYVSDDPMLACVVADRFEVSGARITLSEGQNSSGHTTVALWARETNGCTL